MRLATYLNRRRYWLLALAVALAAPGGVMTTIQSVHLLSRWLIAGGCVVLAIALFAIAAAERQLSTARRWSLRGLGTVALIAAALELLPNQFRSSLALLTVAIALAILLGLTAWIGRSERSSW